MQAPIAVTSCFKYLCMQLFNDNMRSKDSWNGNDDSEAIPCYELHKLNHSANSATCLTKTQVKKTPRGVFTKQFLHKIPK